MKADSTIVWRGIGGAVSIHNSDSTHVIVDIQGYFDPGSSALQFYPMTPCRAVDTRNATGQLGGPYLSGGQTRSFPIQSSACGIPSTAQAYSVNFTAAPKKATLGYLNAWPSGQTQPVTSVLNDSPGIPITNAAILKGGTSGAISTFVSDDTDLAIDVNGYFAPAGTGGLRLYPVAPQCRVIDTRQPAGSLPFTGTKKIDGTEINCGLPNTAQAFVYNATTVPGSSALSLSLWADGQTQPLFPFLMADANTVTSNMAIVPTVDGSTEANTTQPTQLILDVLSYFAP